MADHDPFDGHRDSQGHFARGNPGGPGRPKGPLFMKVLDQNSQDAPTTLHYEMAARGLGLEADQVPVFETIQQLRAWALELASLGGNDQARNALLDRVAPKPSRVVIDASVNHGRASAGTLGESDEADEYLRRLEGDPHQQDEGE